MTDGKTMPRADALFAAMCVGTIAFAAAFVVPLFAEQAVLWYYPLERQWTYETRPTGLAIDFYGRGVLAVMAWSVTVPITIVIARRFAALGTRFRGLLLAWTITAVVFVMFYFAWSLILRVPTPAPIPDWYTPR